MGGAPQPAATEVRLLPLGEAPQELDAIRADLEVTFPGIPISVLPVEPLPSDIHHEGTIYAELLMQHYRERGPGLLVLLDDDLANQLYSAVYSQVDLPHGNAVLSLPRFRTIAGIMPRPDRELTEEALARARVRAGRQAIHSVGRLIGVFPCKEERCMHHRSSTVDILDRADEVCEKHQLILAGLIDNVVQRRAQATEPASETAYGPAPEEVAGDAAPEVEPITGDPEATRAADAP